MTKGSRWRDADGAGLPLDEAVRELERLSPAQAYLARHVLRLSETVGARDEEVAELRGTVRVLTDMLLESGAIDEAALLARVEDVVGRVHVAATAAPRQDGLGEDFVADGEIDDFLRDDFSAESAIVEAPPLTARPLSDRPAKSTEAAPFAKAEARRAVERRAAAAPGPPAPEPEPPAPEPEPEPEAEAEPKPAGYPVAGYGPADSNPYADSFDDDSTFGRRRSRGRRIVVVFFLLAVATGVPAWYYGVHKNPYIGDGPKHLQIDPSRAPTATATKPKKGATAKANKPPTTKKQPAAKKPAAKVAAAKTPEQPLETPYAKLIKEANALFAKRKNGPAFRLLIKAHKLDPSGWEANDRLSWRYYSRGALGRGRRLAKKALAKNPKAPYATLVSAAAADERGQKARARARYKRFLTLCPRCPEVRDVKSALK